MPYRAVYLLAVIPRTLTLRLADVRPLVAFEVAISRMAKGFNRLEIVGLRFGIVLQHCRPAGLLKARAFYAWGSLLDRCRSNLLS
jgi:hypothetical protein